MAKVKTVRELRVWQKSIDLAVAGYRETSRSLAEEKYGITSQIRRAATSIPASGSLRELETHFLVAEKLGYVQPDRLAELLASLDEEGRMIFSLMNRIRRTQANSPKR